MSKLGDDLVSRICTQFERGLLWAATKHDRRADVAPKLGREILAVINVGLGGVASICGENTGRIVDKIGVLAERVNPVVEQLNAIAERINDINEQLDRLDDIDNHLDRLDEKLREIEARQEPGGHGRRY